jgi:hypothetical protein
MPFIQSEKKFSADDFRLPGLTSHGVAVATGLPVALGLNPLRSAPCRGKVS